MIACHSKLGMLLFYHKIIQILLLRKFIAKTESVIVQTKTNQHLTILSFLV